MGVFHIDNPKIKKTMQDIGRTIMGALPEGWGFSLLIFDFEEGDKNGGMFYFSNAERADMIEAMKEFIANAEKEED